MLSILIPVFNYDVTKLVYSLHNQLKAANLEFEIVCVDDASKSPLNKHNKKINSLKDTTFFSNKKNLGYSSNRSFLASISKFNTVIFIDGDSTIINKDFIDKYLEALSENADIIYGGRTQPKLIESPDQKLRCKYGKFVENKPASVRSKNNYKTLMLNNTLIKKSVFDSIKFDPCTDSYGHDDTLFAYQVCLAKLNVIHIENPVMHKDIDKNHTFIKKTETALINLLHLYKSNKISPNFVKILKLYKVLHLLKAHLAVSFFFKLFKSPLKKQLMSSSPSLFLFNVYKIGYMCYHDLKN